MHYEDSRKSIIGDLLLKKAWSLLRLKITALKSEYGWRKRRAEDGVLGAIGI